MNKLTPPTYKAKNCPAQNQALKGRDAPTI
jgi:hypothetical protein